jgi:hypothetical protein
MVAVRVDYREWFRSGVAVKYLPESAQCRQFKEINLKQGNQDEAGQPESSRKFRKQQGAQDEFFPNLVSRL